MCGCVCVRDCSQRFVNVYPCYTSVCIALCLLCAWMSVYVHQRHFLNFSSTLCHFLGQTPTYPPTHTYAHTYTHELPTSEPPQETHSQMGKGSRHICPLIIHKTSEHLKHAAKIYNFQRPSRLETISVCNPTISSAALHAIPGCPASVCIKSLTAVVS